MVVAIWLGFACTTNSIFFFRDTSVRDYFIMDVNVAQSMNIKQFLSTRRKYQMTRESVVVATKDLDDSDEALERCLYLDTLTRLDYLFNSELEDSGLDVLSDGDISDDGCWDVRPQMHVDLKRDGERLRLDWDSFPVLKPVVIEKDETVMESQTQCKGDTPIVRFTRYGLDKNLDQTSCFSVNALKKHWSDTYNKWVDEGGDERKEEEETRVKRLQQFEQEDEQKKKARQSALNEWKDAWERGRQQRTEQRQVADRHAEYKRMQDEFEAKSKEEARRLREENDSDDDESDEEDDDDDSMNNAQNEGGTEKGKKKGKSKTKKRKGGKTKKK